MSACNSLATSHEANDCSVRALAVACNVPYIAAHRALQLEGRAPGWPTNALTMVRAARQLGYRLSVEREFNPPLIDISGAWAGNAVLIFSDHAAGICNGEIIDDVYELSMPVRAILRPKRLKNAQQKIDRLMSNGFYLRLRLWYKRKIKGTFLK